MGRTATLTAISTDIGSLHDEEELSILMAQYQGGDRDAAASLVHRLSPRLYRYLAIPHTQAADVDDLLQDCWMRIHRSRHTYRAEDPLLPWVFAIARHTKLDAYRRRRFRLTKEQLVSTLPEPPSLAGTSPETKYPEVLTLLEKLPESQREVLLMLKVSGMTVEEVARATSSTAGAIKQRAHRAYVRLRELFEKERQR
jgi:RNA polymerase sigma-70 factor (ECF subfamily)